MKLSHLIVIFSLILTTCNPAWADDTDPNGERLKGVVKEYIDNASPDDADANKLKALGVASGNTDGIDVSATSLLCMAETYSGVGTLIWKSRRDRDLCDNLHAKSLYDYCYIYSTYAGHWVYWDDVLKSHNCPTHPNY